MKKLIVLSAIASLATLSACNNSPREQAADNIEANADAAADNIDAAADNAATDAQADNLHNAADATRALGDNQAEDMRTHDADTNLSNGM
jgi:peptidoglycan hydrolase CwlO-like protein